MKKLQLGLKQPSMYHRDELKSDNGSDRSTCKVYTGKVVQGQYIPTVQYDKDGYMVNRNLKEKVFFQGKAYWVAKGIIP